MAVTGWPRPTYVIALKHVVVGQDIAQAIAEFDPSASVIVTKDITRVSVPDDARIALAFLGIGPSAVANSALAASMRQQGARLVLIGDEAEELGDAAGYWVLRRPFTSEAVLAVLHRARDEEHDSATG